MVVAANEEMPAQFLIECQGELELGAIAKDLDLTIDQHTIHLSPADDGV